MDNEGAGYPRTKAIGILVYNDFEPLDVWGFVEAFSIARFIGAGYADAAPFPFNVTLISNEQKTRSSGEKPLPVKSVNGPKVAPDWFRNEALDQSFDLLMIPGGLGTKELLKPNDQDAEASLIDWVRKMDKQVPIITSVCTGAAVLACAGILDGERATTNHQAFSWVSRLGPKVLWDNLSRWVDSGKYVTSAGVSAGTDMAFHLVSRLAGRAVAEEAVKAAEYDWHRDPDIPIFYPQQATLQ